MDARAGLQLFPLSCWDTDILVYPIELDGASISCGEEVSVRRRGQMLAWRSMATVSVSRKPGPCAPPRAVCRP